MFKHISEFQSSEQSILSYCTKHGLQPYNFYYWQRKYNALRVEKFKGNEFIEIPFTATSTPISLQIRTPKGYTLDFTNLPCIDYLSKIVEC